MTENILQMIKHTPPPPTHIPPPTMTASRGRSPTPPPPGEEDDISNPFAIVGAADTKSSKPFSSETTDATEPMDVASSDNTQVCDDVIKGEAVESEALEMKTEPAEPEIKREGEEIERLIKETLVEIANSAVEESEERVKDETMERMDESSSPDVAPVAKAAAPSKPEEGESKENVPVDPEVEAKIDLVQEKAKSLLEEWRNLKEVFKIPKRELIKMRAEHEREADQAADAKVKANLNHRFDSPSGTTAATTTVPQHPPQGPSHLHSQQHPPYSHPPHAGKYSSYGSASGHHYHNHHQSYTSRPDSPPVKRERRVSRFDDNSGLLHIPERSWTLGRTHRRNLFMAKTEQEEKERAKRLKLQQQHENKCYYLRLDPAVTPIFPQYPEYFLDSNGQWAPMPPAYPEIEMSWGYAKMAHLPLEAFREDDPELPNPSYYYPPGVVEVSYLYGPPPEEQLSEEAEVPRQEYLTDAEPLQPAVEEVIFDPNKPPPATTSATNYVPFLNSDPVEEPHVFSENSQPPPTAQPDYEGATDAPLPVAAPPAAAAAAAGVGFHSLPSSTAANGYESRPDVVIRLPPRWRSAKTAEGRTYYYNTKTKETRWDPPDSAEPETDRVLAEYENGEVLYGEIETASTDSDDPLDNDEDGDTDDEDEDEEEEENSENGGGKRAKMENISSDLSAQEKELLMPKKKSREERKHERRQKRERDREKREYERKRRRERHGRHRKAGLVQEHLIPVSPALRFLLLQFFYRLI